MKQIGRMDLSEKWLKHDDRDFDGGKQDAADMVCSLGLTKISLLNQTDINETNWAHGSFGKMAKTRRSISTSNWCCFPVWRNTMMTTAVICTQSVGIQHHGGLIPCKRAHGEKARAWFLNCKAAGWMKSKFRNKVVTHFSHSDDEGWFCLYITHASRRRECVWYSKTDSKNGALDAIGLLV